MSNLMKSNLQIHSCYDLKSTSKGRSNIKVVADNCSVQKDEDFDFSFYLNPLVHYRLLKQIKYDCKLLEAEGIMDYSFLLSIHTKEQHEGLLNWKRSIGGGSSNNGRSLTSKKHMIDDTFKGSYEEELFFAYLCSPSESIVEKFGIEMPTRATRTPKNADGGVSAHRSVRAEEYYDVCLDFGRVDIFQSYHMLKRIEHVYKSLRYDSQSIAAVNPKTYSCRFQDFLSRVFQSADSLCSQIDDGS